MSTSSRQSVTKTLKERCLGAEVMDSLDPGQQVVKIVNEELADLMGARGRPRGRQLRPDRDPDGGTAGLRQDDRLREARPVLQEAAQRRGAGACDVYRPAAVDQLITMGHRAGAHVYEKGTDADPVDIATGRSTAPARSAATSSSSTPPAASTSTRT